MQTGYFLDHIWLISLFPLVGAGLMLLIGRRLPNSAVSMICVGSVFLSFLFSLGAVWQLSHLPGEYPHFEKVLFDWVPAGVMRTSSGLLTNFLAEWGLLLDPLSAVMILVVTGVGFLIHFYSIGYMAQEGGYYRFFGYMNLFMFFMLTLVLANNMLLMFVGWEGVGLSSYLLIGFYFLRKSAADAGKKAFLVNRVGDAGFLLGIFLTVGTLGTIKFTEFGPAIAAGHFVAGAPVLTAIALLLFAGATGKSAQIPLYVWLPDAMEGPTPVSALIHAATMVTAGVYMVTRHNAIYQMAPMAREVVAVIGALTAFFAASIGLVQTDIKRVLAYSTISQLGYMFLACGVGAFAAGIFHLMTHAFFKALLFLGAGSVIHALSGEQDLRRMGGLAEKIRTTWLTMLAATLAIAGIPPLAGFFSKDEILGKTFEHSHLLWVIGLVTAGMTAFYMFRLFLMTFHGPSRVPHEAEHHIHESPGTMTGPLMVLAVLSVVGGWIGIGGRFEHFLEPVIARHGFERAEAGAAAHGGSVEYVLMIASVGIALAGIWLARQFYLERPELPEQLASRWSGLYRLVYGKYYMDEIYDALFVNRVKDLGTTLASFDANVVDGLGVDGAGWLTRTASRLSIWWDTWIVDGLVNLGARIVWLFSYPVRMVQTGLVPNYALLIVLGVLVFLGYYGYHLEILRVWKR
jgi:NADH-quinone oxidoreductase subunit L